MTARPVYQHTGARRTVKGSIRLSGGDRWSARLESPGGSEKSVVLTLERKSRRGVVEPADAALVIPPGELDALMVLLDGLVIEARRVGLLGPPPG